jgi:hypothetical protein
MPPTGCLQSTASNRLSSPVGPLLSCPQLVTPSHPSNWFLSAHRTYTRPGMVLDGLLSCPSKRAAIIQDFVSLRTLAVWLLSQQQTKYRGMAPSHIRRLPPPCRSEHGTHDCIHPGWPCQQPRRHGQGPARAFTSHQGSRSPSFVDRRYAPVSHHILACSPGLYRLPLTLP